MKPFNKINAAHASAFGIDGDSNELYSLIDRLQKHSEWKYPERKWTIDSYYAIAFQWIGKEDELKKRVLELELYMSKAK